MHLLWVEAEIPRPWYYGGVGLGRQVQRAATFIVVRLLSPLVLLFVLVPIRILVFILILVLVLILSVFFVPYVVFAVPVAFVGKKFGPARVLPILMFIFGSMTLLSAAVKNFGGMMATRWILGEWMYAGRARAGC